MKKKIIHRTISVCFGRQSITIEGDFKKICFFPFVNVFRQHGFDDVAKQNDMKM